MVKCTLEVLKLLLKDPKQGCESKPDVTFSLGTSKALSERIKLIRRHSYKTWPPSFTFLPCFSSKHPSSYNSKTYSWPPEKILPIG